MSFSSPSATNETSKFIADNAKGRGSNKSLHDDNFCKERNHNSGKLFNEKISNVNLTEVEHLMSNIDVGESHYPCYEKIIATGGTTTNVLRSPSNRDPITTITTTESTICQDRLSSLSDSAQLPLHHPDNLDASSVSLHESKATLKATTSTADVRYDDLVTLQNNEHQQKRFSFYNAADFVITGSVNNSKKANDYGAGHSKSTSPIQPNPEKSPQPRQRNHTIVRATNSSVEAQLRGIETAENAACALGNHEIEQPNTNDNSAVPNSLSTKSNSFGSTSTTKSERKRLIYNFYDANEVQLTQAVIATVTEQQGCEDMKNNNHNVSSLTIDARYVKSEIYDNGKTFNKRTSAASLTNLNDFIEKNEDTKSTRETSYNEPLCSIDESHKELDSIEILRSLQIHEQQRLELLSGSVGESVLGGNKKNSGKLKINSNNSIGRIMSKSAPGLTELSSISSTSNCVTHNIKTGFEAQSENYYSTNDSSKSADNQSHNFLFVGVPSDDHIDISGSLNGPQVRLTTSSDPYQLDNTDFMDSCSSNVNQNDDNNTNSSSGNPYEDAIKEALFLLRRHKRYIPTSTNVAPVSAAPSARSRYIASTFQHPDEQGLQPLTYNTTTSLSSLSSQGQQLYINNQPITYNRGVHLDINEQQAQKLGSSMLFDSNDCSVTSNRHDMSSAHGYDRKTDLRVHTTTTNFTSVNRSSPLMHHSDGDSNLVNNTGSNALADTGRICVDPDGHYSQSSNTVSGSNQTQYNNIFHSTLTPRLDGNTSNTPGSGQSSALVVGDAYQAEIEVRRRQRQERMARYASRLAELKNQPSPATPGPLLEHSQHQQQHFHENTNIKQDDAGNDAGNDARNDARNDAGVLGTTTTSSLIPPTPLLSPRTISPTRSSTSSIINSGPMRKDGDKRLSSGGQSISVHTNDKVFNHLTMATMSTRAANASDVIIVNDDQAQPTLVWNELDDDAKFLTSTTPMDMFSNPLYYDMMNGKKEHFYHHDTTTIGWNHELAIQEQEQMADDVTRIQLKDCQWSGQYIESNPPTAVTTAASNYMFNYSIDEIPSSSSSSSMMSFHTYTKSNKRTMCISKTPMILPARNGVTVSTGVEAGPFIPGQLNSFTLEQQQKQQNDIQQGVERVLLAILERANSGSSSRSRGFHSSSSVSGGDNTEPLRSHQRHQDSSLHVGAHDVVSSHTNIINQRHYDSSSSTTSANHNETANNASFVLNHNLKMNYEEKKSSNPTEDAIVDEGENSCSQLQFSEQSALHTHTKKVFHDVSKCDYDDSITRTTQSFDDEDLISNCNTKEQDALLRALIDLLGPPIPMQPVSSSLLLHTVNHAKEQVQDDTSNRGLLQKWTGQSAEGRYNENDDDDERFLIRKNSLSKLDNLVTNNTSTPYCSNYKDMNKNTADGDNDLLESEPTHNATGKQQFELMLLASDSITTTTEGKHEKKKISSPSNTMTSATTGNLSRNGEKLLHQNQLLKDAHVELDRVVELATTSATNIASTGKTSGYPTSADENTEGVLLTVGGNHTDEATGVDPDSHFSNTRNEQQQKQDQMDLYSDKVDCTEKEDIDFLYISPTFVKETTIDENKATVDIEDVRELSYCTAGDRLVSDRFASISEVMSGPINESTGRWTGLAINKDISPSSSSSSSSSISVSSSTTSIVSSSVSTSSSTSITYGSDYDEGDRYHKTESDNSTVPSQQRTRNDPPSHAHSSIVVTSSCNGTGTLDSSSDVTSLARCIKATYDDGDYHNTNSTPKSLNKLVQYPNYVSTDIASSSSHGSSRVMDLDKYSFSRICHSNNRDDNDNEAEQDEYNTSDREFEEFADFDNNDDGRTNSSSDSEAYDLMRSLCGHLLLFGDDAIVVDSLNPTRSSGREGHWFDVMPKWDETNIDEPGYRIVRLDHYQLRRIQLAFVRFIEHQRSRVVKHSVTTFANKHTEMAHNQEPHPSKSLMIGMSRDETTFERDLQEAEDLLDRYGKSNTDENVSLEYQGDIKRIDTIYNNTSTTFCGRHDDGGAINNTIYPHELLSKSASSRFSPKINEKNNLTNNSLYLSDENDKKRNMKDGEDEKLTIETDEIRLENFHGIKPVGKGEMGDIEFFTLPIVFKSHVTGFEPTKDLLLDPGNIVAGQYLVEGVLGSAAFSTAYKCVNLNIPEHADDNERYVCLKVIKNTKDFFDQSLDEIKILELLRQTGKCHEMNIIEMKTFFYYREHLIIVTELLRQNLFEFGKYILESGEETEPYFTIPRLCYITRQCLVGLKFVHSLGLVHSDIKPENILLASYSRAAVKVIDFGSSCWLTDRQSSYIQSRSYRAPEVILGLPYDGRIDMWSLGCVVAEMYTGEVTFQNDSIISMLCRIDAIVGPFPRHMIDNGRQSSRFFTKCGLLYELVGREQHDGEKGSFSDDDDDDESQFHHPDDITISSDEGDNGNMKMNKKRLMYIDIFQPKKTTLASRLGLSHCCPTIANLYGECHQIPSTTSAHISKEANRFIEQLYLFRSYNNTKRSSNDQGQSIDKLSIPQASACKQLKHQHQDSFSPHKDDLSIMFVDFVRKLLTIDPEQRLTADEALHHPLMLYAETLTEESVKYPSST